MKSVSRIVLAALLVTASGSLLSVPAFAADKPAAEAPKLKLSKPVQALLVEAQKLSAAGDNAGALAKTDEALAYPTPSTDDTYMTNAIRLNIGIGTKDVKLQEAALRGLMATGKVPPADQPKFLRNMGAMALQRNDYAAATTDFEKLIALNPNDSEALVGLAELYYRQNQTAKATATMTKAIEVAKASGQPAAEAIYRRRLAIAYGAKMTGEIESSSMALVEAYPNAVNWRDALSLFREGTKLDAEANLDVLRLMQSAGSLNGERDYAEYADAAANKGLPGEAKAVLTEGISKGMLSPTKQFVKELSAVVDPKVPADKAGLPSQIRDAQKSPKSKLPQVTGDALYGYGQYAEAATMYKLARDSGVTDPDLANTRLGMVQAKLGDKVAAKAAFDAVKGAGPRAALAKYWLIWLGQQK